METTKGSILMQKYEIGRLLGQGTFAKVYHGRNLKTGQSVAIKVIDKEKVVRVGLIDQTKREISAMSMVKHEHVVQFEEVLATKTKIYFVMEHAKGGELFRMVSKGKLRDEAARKYFHQLISAVSFCHDRGVYHRDLKPENLLLDEHRNLKVSDFGLSALAESRRVDGLLHTACGTPAYVAPEVIGRGGYDGAKADIWSCGVVLFVLLAGYLPFSDSNVVEMYRKISRGEYRCPGWFPPAARRLLMRILDPNPLTRITMAKIMESSWFRKGLTRTKNEKNIGDEPKVEITERPMNLNAFDIISLSSGFDLSGLFVGSDEKDEVRFTSAESGGSIVSRFEEIAGEVGMRVARRDGGHVRLEGGRKRSVLAIDVWVFAIAASFHVVEMRKSGGDSVEYREVVRRDIRPALKEIVWAWQGEQPVAVAG